MRDLTLEPIYLSQELSPHQIELAWEWLDAAARVPVEERPPLPQELPPLPPQDWTTLVDLLNNQMALAMYETLH